MYLLDTNILSYLQAGNQKVKAKIANTNPQELATCSIVMAELCFGAFLNPTKTQLLLSKYQKLAKTIEVFNFNFEESLIFGNLKTVLRQKDKIIEDFDLMVASICLANDCTLVTHNTKDFQNIPKLKVEDWLE